MAVEGPIEFFQLQKELENTELEAPGGVTEGVVYSKLLALYMLNNEMCQAKFLWKRIPQTVKSATPDLGLLWTAAQKLWQRDYPGTYDCLRKEFSVDIKPIVDALIVAVRRRAMTLVANAYSSLSVEDLAAFAGMSAPEAIQAAGEEGWKADAQGKFITPVKPAPPDEPAPLSDQQLSALTDYVSFLER